MNVIESYPEVKDKLSKAKKCSICRKPFLTEWLECVYFVAPSKVNCFFCVCENEYKGYSVCPYKWYLYPRIDSLIGFMINTFRKLCYNHYSLFYLNLRSLSQYVHSIKIPWTRGMAAQTFCYSAHNMHGLKIPYFNLSFSRNVKKLIMANGHCSRGSGTWENGADK
jgi:hypothetical protein